MARKKKEEEKVEVDTKSEEVPLYTTKGRKRYQFHKNSGVHRRTEPVVDKNGPVLDEDGKQIFERKAYFPMGYIWLTDAEAMPIRDKFVREVSATASAAPETQEEMEVRLEEEAEAYKVAKEERLKEVREKAKADADEELRLESLKKSSEDASGTGSLSGKEPDPIT